MRMLTVLVLQDSDFKPEGERDLGKPFQGQLREDAYHASLTAPIVMYRNRVLKNRLGTAGVIAEVPA
ncbi:hypothetical protein C7H84_09530 [Burkholderia sp. Nafp2/4-1b]|uniref:hypothetical protein n=1 Tax=Burkholderia sp. Nafp2/4-1b TaxID=2116686 RepID=UPI000EF91A0D|nr:hypothetical protein [Burkholderia sp. Nafp2/4-1b]RKU03369.1 hypothetical protein C7H84_09530 [Burkholderia sp. Nafp2/4-1b]